MTQTWRLHAASARRHLDCSPEAITAGCGGCCCTTRAGRYWPPISCGTNDGVCPHLGPAGCRLGESRPVTCHLYPFKLNAMNTLVVHFWALLKGCCRKNTHTHRTAWESIRPSFELLFGTEQVERADEHIASGVDPYFKVPEHIARRYLLEAEWDKEKVVPGPFDMSGEDRG